MRSPLKLLVHVVSKRFQELITVARKLESEMQPGLGFHSCAIEDANHETLTQPGVHTPNCSVTDCDGYLEAFSTQHVYGREKDWKVVYRDVLDEREQN